MSRTQIGRRGLAATAAGLALGMGMGGAQAQGGRPLRIIVPFPPGSATDAMARFIGDRSAPLLRQPVVVENMPGANGAIAARAAARLPPDGQAVLFSTNSTHAGNQHLMREPGYDPIRDFAPVTLIGLAPLMLFVRGDSPAKTLSEFLIYARSQQGRMNFGTGNTGSLVAAHLLMQRGGFEAEQISYRGTAEATTDLLGGRLHFMVTDMGPVTAHVQAGTLRALATTSRVRSVALPDVPTMHESGLPDFDYASWNAIHARAGSPPEVIRTLNSAFVEVIRSPEGTAFFRNLGINVVASTPEQLGEFNASELRKWEELVALARIPKT
ncbi:tripartite tricarboxylate transporter substrate binding protein [Falsiroseomonas sp.]|uniref:Bug family tripartite tricarboxylate transporter substrate binding protein n=1 Tax=Falsiroseomonas sp. TaxID=2870721 RepID=UPI002728800F|nr:tripartite tricarboxylate transporter substrate binding protein [Falsiroseomonas sp.]MDO9499297.1 tripartite tricarboxylate transporter substrate binding protein [Falsiroseomonas sp.]